MNRLLPAENSEARIAMLEREDSNVRELKHCHRKTFTFWANGISLVLQLHKMAQIAFCCIAVR